MFASSANLLGTSAQLRRSLNTQGRVTVLSYFPVNTTCTDEDDDKQPLTLHF